MGITSMPRKELARKAATRVIVSVPVLAALFFVPAGTLAYWEAWLYMIVLLVPVAIFGRYLYIHEPELLERRLRTEEKEPIQRWIQWVGGLAMLIGFVVPGLDRRFGWSDVSLETVLLADVVMLIGYGIFIRVMLENRFASRVIDVEESQSVISTGPYAVVRHPMYSGVLLIYLASPLALGSYWALIPICVAGSTVVVRILNEEKVLARDLNGYREYLRAVRYRLIPGVW